MTSEVRSSCAREDDRAAELRGIEAYKKSIGRGRQAEDDYGLAIRRRLRAAASASW